MLVLSQVSFRELDQQSKLQRLKILLSFSINYCFTTGAQHLFHLFLGKEGKVDSTCRSVLQPRGPPKVV